MMDETGLPDDFGASIARAAAQTFGAMSELFTERYEYRLVGWSQVNELARQGWLLVPMSAGHEFVMSRKLGPADDAEQVLKQAGEVAP